MKKNIEADGAQCQTLPRDLMDANNCKEIVELHIKKYGGLDVLVNNASKQIMCESIVDIEVGRAGFSFSEGKRRARLMLVAGECREHV